MGNLSQEEFLEKMRDPGDDYSAVPFWFFNDAPDEKKIRAQLTDMKEKGVSAFVLHPRIGIPRDIPYLSDRYFDAVSGIVQTAASLDMKVCLYDILRDRLTERSSPKIRTGRPEGSACLTQRAAGRAMRQLQFSRMANIWSIPSPAGQSGAFISGRTTEKIRRRQPIC